MAIKGKQLKKLTEAYLDGLRTGSSEWIPFLDTASRMYKYRFANQLAVYLQKPEATAATTMYQWNRMGRSINRGCKGIRLNEQDRFDTSIYIFDADDTHNRIGQNVQVRLWEVSENETFRERISEQLAELYQISSDMELSDLIQEAAKEAVDAEYLEWVDQVTEENPELCTAEFADDLDRLYAFIIKSAQYVTLRRCGMEVSRYSEEDFNLTEIQEGRLLQQEMLQEIGSIVQRSAESVLVCIEKEAKELLVRERTLLYNQQKENQRRKEKEDGLTERGNQLQEDGERLPSGISGGQRGANLRRNRGQVRNDESTVSIRGEGSHLLEHEPAGNTITTSEGSEPDGGRDAEDADSEKGGSLGAVRGDEEQESNQMGQQRAAYHDGSGERNREGIDYHLDIYKRNQNVPYFSDTKLKQGIILQALKDNGKEVEDVYLFFDANYDRVKQAKYTEKLFHNAYCEFDINGESVGYKTFDNGLLLWKGHYSSKIEENILSWEGIAELIDGLRLLEMNEGIRSMTASEESQISFLEEQPERITFGQSIVDYALRQGSNMQGSKRKIYKFYLENPNASIAERINFLKEEYGIGGRSGFHTGLDLWEMHDGKGIRLSWKAYQDEKDIIITWNQAAKRIGELIKEDTYLYQDEFFEDTLIASEKDLPAEDSQNDYLNLYMLLSRLKQDCDYYLGAGNRNEKHLWAGNVTDQISKMREIWNQLFKKPEWLTADDLDHYEKAMRQEKSENVLVKDETLSALQEFEQKKDELEIKEASESAENDFEERDYIPGPIKTNPGKTGNYHITDRDLGKGYPAQKFRNNMEAIKLLKQLEAEDREATKEEQDTLAAYVGWGGLSSYFEEGSWYQQELIELLTEEEYRAAADSTLNAHYTQPMIIEKMYDIFDNLGFVGGKLLEPAMGVGNFFGMLPKRFQKDTKLYGVELDTISARIAARLYPEANVYRCGYEETSFRDNSFDAAIGNIPFGDYSVHDKKYDRHGFLIHDYFFAKTIDQVKPGGVIAFITSKGTLDKKNSSVRKYIAERADLLGAIRLPNTAFKENAGAEVTSDILILQKRAEPQAVKEEVSWLHLGRDENNLTYNQYFIDHPEMVIGEMQEVSGRFGQDAACILTDDATFEQRMDRAVRQIQGSIAEVALFDEYEDTTEGIPADPALPNYAYSVVDEKVYYRENDVMIPQESGGSGTERLKELIKLRDIVRQLIDSQLEGAGDAEIEAQQESLSDLYDKFKAKYGLINSRSNSLAFRDDSSYPLLCSLEVLDDDGKLARKADIFTMRTVRRAERVINAETVQEALAVSLSEKACVDIPYMMQLSGKSEEELINDLSGQIYRVPDIEHPDSKNYATADEYLSGNVRRKLAQAKLLAAANPAFEQNVKALEDVMPEPLTAADIDVELGSVWVPEDVYTSFILELLQPSQYASVDIAVRYNRLSGEWGIEGAGGDALNVLANTTYGTSRANAYRIIKNALNMQTVNITDTFTDVNGKKHTQQNQKETALANQKQDLIKSKFKSWIWEEPERRQRLEEIYNERFNSCVAREFDGSHLNFPGMNPQIELRDHQKRAVARQLYGGNTLLAHCVGAGKTYEMAAAIMEKKRLGLCNKAMLVVPNHLTGQWAAEFMRLYSNAKVLAVTKQDFKPENRKKFCARIATGDYDAVIIGHSQFEMIPLSKRRQRAFIEEQLDDVQAELIALKAEQGETYTVKQLAGMEKKLKVKLEKLNDAGRKDNVVTFEQLGVDFLCVDEAHNYKNLAFNTKMSNVAGISTTGANKSYDMFAKCRYMDELTGGKGITFATGTPISNSMSEVYTMQRYLQYDQLKDLGISTFDGWASVYGHTETTWELAPEGSKYRQRTRFAHFQNMPELMSVFKDTADIITADMIDLDVPEAETENVLIPATAQQAEMIHEIGIRADRIRDGLVDPTVDNMLKISTDGRRLALDERLITGAQEHPLGETKVDLCVQKCMELYRDTMDSRSAQLIFCDQSTPRTDGSFTIYEAVKTGLMSEGVPEDEIAFIHDYNTESAKEDLFSKVRSGRVRFLLGSTQKMGAGMNVQTRLIAAHHLDVPWRPADLEQRNGRLIRQGNTNEKVYIYKYVTENTFDAYSWQTLETKQRGISQIMTSKNPARRCEDVDMRAFEYAETKALCCGDDRIKEQMELQNSVNQLRLLKQNFDDERYRLQNQLLRLLPAEFKEAAQRHENYARDIALLSEYRDKPFEITVAGIKFTEPAMAGEAIYNLTVKYKDSDRWERIGNYRGFDLETSFYDGRYRLRLHGSGLYNFERGAEPRLIISRIDEKLEDIEELETESQKKMEQLSEQMKRTEKELQREFVYADELAQKEARLEELNAELQREETKNTEEMTEEAYAYSHVYGYILIEKEGDDTFYGLYDRDFECCFNERRLYVGDEIIMQCIAEDVLLKEGYTSTAVEQTDVEWLKEQIRVVETTIQAADEFEVG